MSIRKPHVFSMHFYAVVWFFLFRSVVVRDCFGVLSVALVSLLAASLQCARRPRQLLKMWVARHMRPSVQNARSYKKAGEDL